MDIPSTRNAVRHYGTVTPTHHTSTSYIALRHTSAIFACDDDDVTLPRPDSCCISTRIPKRVSWRATFNCITSTLLLHHLHATRLHGRRRITVTSSISFKPFLTITPHHQALRRHVCTVLWKWLILFLYHQHIIKNIRHLKSTNMWATFKMAHPF